MADENFSKRSLAVLTVVVGCFAVLWPKVFYPMMLSCVYPSETVDGDFYEKVSNENLQKMLHPHMWEAMGEARPSDQISRGKSKVSIHPLLRQYHRPQSKGAGAVNLVVPIYTVGILLFFLYTFMKVAVRKLSKEQNFLDCCPTRHKLSRFMEQEAINKKKDNTLDRKTQRALEQYNRHQVLAALKTIILEMEEFKAHLAEADKCASYEDIDESDETDFIQ